MDILRTLYSILTPGISPANRARPTVPVPETQAGPAQARPRSFAQTLEEAAGNDPSIAPFGLRTPRAIPTRVSEPVTVTRPEIEPLAPGTANPAGIFNGIGGPTILPQNPAIDTPVLDLPVDQRHVEIGDTLESTFTKGTETLTKPEPLLPPPDLGTPPTSDHGAAVLGGPMPDDPRLLAPDTALVSKYSALAGGGTAGGNFERFKDAAARGFFSDDQAGYARYLQYNSSSDAPRLSRPDFCGWMQAADLVYAIRSGAHQTNDQSPVWDAATAVPFGQSAIRGMTTAANWTPQQRQAALNEFARTFQHLYAAWVPNGAPLPTLNT